MLRKNIKKVMLITPPAFTFKNLRDINPMPPMGLGYIAAVLEKAGKEVRIFDSLVEDLKRAEEISKDVIRIGASFDRIECEIRSFAPDMVGVSNLFSRQASNAHRVYALIKKIDPSIVVVAGGAHPTVLSETVMEDKNVDFAVLGEGENVIMDIIAFLRGDKGADSLSAVAMRTDKGVRILPRNGFIEDLDALPLPARHLMHMEKYFGLPMSHGKRHSRRFSPIVTSRGCPAGCTFCTAHHVWGRKFRKRSSANVIAELKELKARYGIEEILFEDDNITMDVGRAEEIFDMMISEKLDLKWDTPNGVAAFALNNVIIKKMKESGCCQLNIAVESGNQHVLKNIIKKPLDLGKVKPIIKYARSIGLNTGIFLIIGMPGETLEQMWESYKFARDVGAYDAFISIATPYPGSELYETCKKSGLIDKDFSLDDLYITSCSISTDQWTGDDVRNMFNKGYTYLRMHYFIRHPGAFLAKLVEKAIRDPKDIIGKVGLLCRKHTKA